MRPKGRWTRRADRQRSVRRKTVAGDRCLAPTIGHIVPINNPLNMMHGHTDTNTFTNCAACNNKQSAAVVIDGHQNYANPRSTYLSHVARLGYPFGET